MQLHQATDVGRFGEMSDRPVGIRIRDSATQTIEEIDRNRLVLPMPKETHPDCPRAFSERESVDEVRLWYTPMGPEGSLAVSQVVRQRLETFAVGEMVFLETSERDRRDRAIWKLVQRL